MRPAVFLDRDGTLIEQVHHLNRVEDVAVFPFAMEALQSLRSAGFATVIVTNQSAIGRGLLTPDGLSAVHQEMFRQLGDSNLIDAIYYSTTVPISGDPQVIEDPDRKPGPGMLLRAASDLQLDISRSWMIGDAISDILAGRNAGCLGTVLVRTGYGRRTELEHMAGKLQVAGCTLQVDTAADYVAEDLLAAARLIVQLNQT